MKISFTDPSGTDVDRRQLENLHAFLLAIDEVNKRNDILPDHHVNFVIRTPFADSVIKINSASLDLIENNVSGVVGSLDNFGTDASNRYFNEFKIVQSHSLAMGTEFGIGENYPFKVQTVPIDSFQGSLFLKIFLLQLSKIFLFRHGYTKFIMFNIWYYKICDYCVK